MNLIRFMHRVFHQIFALTELDKWILWSTNEVQDLIIFYRNFDFVGRHVPSWYDTLMQPEQREDDSSDLVLIQNHTTWSIRGVQDTSMRKI
jgi:hypothetical protein